MKALKFLRVAVAVIPRAKSVPYINAPMVRAMTPLLLKHRKSLGKLRFLQSFLRQTEITLMRIWAEALSTWFSTLDSVLGYESETLDSIKAKMQPDVYSTASEFPAG